MRLRIGPLRTDILRNLGDLGGIHKSTLNSGNIVSLCIQHVPATDELIGALGIQNRTGIDFRSHPKGDSGREVRLDNAGNHIYRRPLGRNDQVDTYGTGQLRQTCDGRFDFLSGGHDQIGKLVNDQYDVGQKLVAVVRIQLSGLEFRIVFLDIPDHRGLE